VAGKSPAVACASDADAFDRAAAPYARVFHASSFSGVKKRTGLPISLASRISAATPMLLRQPSSYFNSVTSSDGFTSRIIGKCSLILSLIFKIDVRSHVTKKLQPLRIASIK
jgi:hypothetical protein